MTAEELKAHLDITWDLYDYSEKEFTQYLKLLFKSGDLNISAQDELPLVLDPDYGYMYMKLKYIKEIPEGVLYDRYGES
jgi:hypothetical protein